MTAVGLDGLAGGTFPRAGYTGLPPPLRPQRAVSPCAVLAAGAGSFGYTNGPVRPGGVYAVAQPLHGFHELGGAVDSGRQFAPAPLAMAAGGADNAGGVWYTPAEVQAAWDEYYRTMSQTVKVRFGARSMRQMPATVQYIGPDHLEIADQIPDDPM